MKLLPISLLALCLGSAALLPAQTVITVTGRADNASYLGAGAGKYSDKGYTDNATYTFAFSVASVPTPNSSEDTGITSYSISLASGSSADGPVFSAVGGSGTTGTYVDPADRELTLYLGLNGGTPDMQIRAAAAVGTGDIGLKMLDNSTLVTGLHFYGDSADLPLASSVMPAAVYDPELDTDVTPWVDPRTFFADLVGTYTGPFETLRGGGAVLSGGKMEVIYDGGSLFFTPTSLTITSAIPEPSTYAALSGGVILGLALWSRRKRVSSALVGR